VQKKCLQVPEVIYLQLPFEGWRDLKEDSRLQVNEKLQDQREALGRRSLLLLEMMCLLDSFKFCVRCFLDVPVVKRPLLGLDKQT
jgi:hypothetical protein